MKDRNETERRLLNAVSAVVEKEGISGIGINRIAAEAACSKVLIYRYFDDLDGLLTRWAEDNNYFIRKGRGMDLKSLAAAPIDEKRKITADVFKGQLNELRKDAIMRELHRWQLNDDNEVCKNVMALAEERGLALTGAISENTETELDVEAIIAIIVSGIFYLNLSSDHAPVFNGVALDTDQGWNRIEGAIDQITDIIFSQIKETKK